MVKLFHTHHRRLLIEQLIQILMTSIWSKAELNRYLKLVIHLTVLNLIQFLLHFHLAHLSHISNPTSRLSAPSLFILLQSTRTCRITLITDPPRGTDCLTPSTEWTCPSITRSDQATMGQVTRATVSRFTCAKVTGAVQLDTFMAMDRHFIPSSLHITTRQTRWPTMVITTKKEKVIRHRRHNQQRTSKRNKEQHLIRQR